MDLPIMLPIKFGYIFTYGFRGELFKKLVNQKQELPLTASFVVWLGLNKEPTYTCTYLHAYVSLVFNVKVCDPELQGT